MLVTLQPQTPASFIREIRKTDPQKKPAIVVPVRTQQVKAISSKKEGFAPLPGLQFEKWNLPPQPEGYIKCRKHDFL